MCALLRCDIAVNFNPNILKYNSDRTQATLWSINVQKIRWKHFIKRVTTRRRAYVSQRIGAGNGKHRYQVFSSDYFRGF